MSETIRTELRAGNAQFKAAFHDAAASVKQWRAEVGRAVSGAKESLGGMKGGLIGVAGAGLALRKALGAAGEFERLKTQLTVLLRSADAAEQRMTELAKFGANTPFELTEVVKASVTLETLTRGALSTGKGLEMVGDLAAGAGEDLGNMAMHVGRLYDGLMSGRPVGESMMRLQELGIISGDTRGRIEALQKQGKKGEEVWRVAAESFSKFSGTMAAQSGTLFGILSNLRDQYDALAREMGQPIAEALKPVLTDLIENMDAYKARARELGADIVAVGSFLAEHRKALLGLAAAWYALRGTLAVVEVAKATVALGSALAGVVARTAGLVDSRVALEAESAALARNTAAQLANTSARVSTVAGGAAAGRGWISGLVAAVATGARAAGLLAAKALGAGVTTATAPVALVAGTLAVVTREWADLKTKQAESALALNEWGNKALAFSSAAVHAARTEAETAAAREEIERRIARVREVAAKANTDAKREVLAGVEASLRALSADADRVRVMEVQRALAGELAAKKELEAENDRYSVELAAAVNEKIRERAKLLESEARETAARVAEQRDELGWRMFDLADAKRQVDFLAAYLKRSLAAASADTNFEKRVTGDRSAPVDFRSSADIAREVEVARGSGQVRRAEQLLGLLKATLDMEQKLAAAKKETTADAERSAGVAAARERLGTELQAMRAEAAGDARRAESMRREAAIREEAAALARDLNLTESAALALAREKAELARATADAARREAQARATRDEAGELAVLRLRAAGKTGMAAALEQEISMRREAAELATRTGMSESRALLLVREKARLQRVADTAGSRTVPAALRRAPVFGSGGTEGAHGLGRSVHERRAMQYRADGGARDRAAAARFYERSIAVQEETLRVWQKLGVA